MLPSMHLASPASAEVASWKGQGSECPEECKVVHCALGLDESLVCLLV
jgi:hypothetical protein